MRVLVAGSLTKDIIQLPDRRISKPGGGIFYAGGAYAAAHAKLSLCYASDRNSTLSLQSEFHESAEHLVQWSANITQFVNRCSQNGSRDQEIIDVCAAIEMPQDLPSFDVQHLCPLHHDDLQLDWYLCEASAGSRKALDIQGLLRPSRKGLVRHQSIRNLHQLIQSCSEVKASTREWQFLVHSLECDEQTLIERFPRTRFLVTAGSAGGRLLQHGSPQLSWSALRKLDHMDTTGAGDIFFAHYLMLTHDRMPDQKILTEADRLTNLAITGRDNN